MFVTLSLKSRLRLTRLRGKQMFAIILLLDDEFSKSTQHFVDKTELNLFCCFYDLGWRHSSTKKHAACSFASRD